MKRKPWLKLWCSEWLSDPHLRACRPEDRGNLIDLMSLAHMGRPYGHLTNGGLPLTPDDMAKALRCHPRSFGVSLERLLSKRRVIKDSDGTYFIPRMVRENAESIEASELGEKGGNPTLKGTDKATLKPYGEGEGEGEGEGDGYGEGERARLLTTIIGQNLKAQDAYRQIITIGQFRRLGFEDFCITCKGRGVMPENIIESLIPLVRTASWRDVWRHGEARWLGWQLDDMNKRNGGSGHGRSDADQHRTEKLGREYPEPTRPPPIIKL